MAAHIAAARYLLVIAPNPLLSSRSEPFGLERPLAMARQERTARPFPMHGKVMQNHRHVAAPDRQP
jgi:hypothetical protein